MSTIRNPTWARDEFILALDLYFRVDPARHTSSTPEVIELSELLGRLNIHSHIPHPDTFRNANGVAMKLGNLRWYDPRCPGGGLERGSRSYGEIWDEFHADRDRLSQLAEAIRRHVPAGEDSPAPALEENVEGAPEGRVLLRAHRVRERSASLRRRKLAQARRADGCLRCEVYGFDFEKAYGEVGDGYIECHHRTPVAELRPDSRTWLVDLALVCSNCHAMLHRGSAPTTVEELRLIMDKLGA
jgi:5-methylcytosine-specific restriction protein A